MRVVWSFRWRRERRLKGRKVTSSRKVCFPIGRTGEKCRCENCRCGGPFLCLEETRSTLEERVSDEPATVCVIGVSDEVTARAVWDLSRPTRWVKKPSLFTVNGAGHCQSNHSYQTAS